ncbi:MAG: hypothetical protein GXP48_00365 [Acidobacteria bacterium]|nr:hypothetical protein [Acidobacteriota bacterium]
MSDPQLIWRFGRWVGARSTGTARLGWTGGGLILAVRGAKAVSVEGPDPSDVSNALGCSPTGQTNLLLEARAAASRTGADETRAVAIVKSIVEAGIRSWILDERRTLELVEGEVPAGDGPTISLPHAIVEMVLSDESDELPRTVLQDRRVLLRRSPGFLEGYASLQLTEEADLVAAKITGQRTAEEIIERSPQDSDEVMRLLVALVVAGFLEPVLVADLEQERASIDPVFVPPVQAAARRLPPALIIGGVILLAVILAAVGWLVLHHAHSKTASPARWGIVIDRGCQPQDLQRILEKAGKHPRKLVAQPDSQKMSEPCWELVWGSFRSKAEARKALARIPKSLVRRGVTGRIVTLSKTPGSPGGRGN